MHVFCGLDLKCGRNNEGKEMPSSYLDFWIFVANYHILPHQLNIALSHNNGLIFSIHKFAESHSKSRTLGVFPRVLSVYCSFFL